jgi:hypothetical protein
VHWFDLLASRTGEYMIGSAVFSPFGAGDHDGNDFRQCHIGLTDPDMHAVT